MFLLFFTLLILVIASYFDLQTRKIPNQLTFPVILVGFGYNLALSGLSGLEESFTGLLIGGGLLLIPFILGGMGAGDVKLMAAVGALNGFHITLYAVLYSAVAGGVIALGYSMIKRKASIVLLNTFFALPFMMGTKAGNLNLNKVNSGIRFPYAVAILTGTITAFLLR